MSGEWQSFAGHGRGVWLRLAFVDLVGGDITAAIVLSQLAYWAEDQRGRVVHRDGEEWRPHPHCQWWDECRLSKRSAKRALGILEDLGFIETNVWKVGNAPTMHVRLVTETLDAAVRQMVADPPELESDDTRLSESESDGSRLSESDDTRLSWKVTDRAFPPYIRVSKPEKEESEGAIVPIDPDARKHRELCERLSDAMVANGCKPPTITKRWLDATRLMIERDGRSYRQIAECIDWCQNDEFWRTNIHSMPTLRDKYDRLKMDKERKHSSPRNKPHPLDGARTAAREMGLG